MTPIDSTSTASQYTGQDSGNVQVSNARRRVILLTGSQIETTLCFLDGIIRHHMPNAEITRLVLGTLAGVNPKEYTPDVERQVVALFCDKQPEVVFVSLIEFGLPRLSRLIERLRKEFSFLCVAGGPYAIEYPDECADTGLFDVVNYSHGLHSWQVVAQPNDLSSVPNIMFRPDRAQNTWIRNRPCATAFAMDEMPMPYWGLDNLYLLVNPSWWDKTALDETTIRHMNGSGGAYPVEHHQWPARHSGVVVMSTGCPVNTCDFCSISRMYDQERKLFKEEDTESRHALRKVSWWSPLTAIRVLENYVTCRPNTRYFVFNDNDFASIPKEDYKEFLLGYKERIGLPIYCQSSPHLTLVKGSEFVDILIEAGLDTYCMGVESNANCNKSMYNRRGGNHLIFDAINLLEPHMKSGKVHLALDFINGNAAETRENLLNTIDLIRILPLPWDLAIHNLTLSDNTPLAQRIKSDKLQATNPEPHVLLHDKYLSDYHHANLSVFLALKECWLNLVLQWLGGLHNDQRTGCFLRDFSAFSQQAGIFEVRSSHPAFDSLVRHKESLHSSYDFLIDAEVIDFMQGHPEIMVALYTNMPEITYGYHESDRYSFDWKTASRYLIAAPAKS